ncbi:hypothetical protein GCM10023115_19390 [Pontixanthobacter gangjinensis]
MDGLSKDEYFLTFAPSTHENSVLHGCDTGNFYRSALLVSAVDSHLNGRNVDYDRLARLARLTRTGFARYRFPVSAAFTLALLA